MNWYWMLENYVVDRNGYKMHVADYVSDSIQQSGNAANVSSPDYSAHVIEDCIRSSTCK